MRYLPYLLIFLTGFLSCILLINYSNISEIPLSLSTNNNPNAPGDWIKQDQIQITNDKIIISIKDASLSSYAATGSMKPVFDKEANGIRIKPTNESQINIGDIISYQSNDNLIVHRVIEKGADSDGVYFVVKGDNNNLPDKNIRFKDIKYITIGILY